ncbi:uncharacterized protein EV420DRAFT_321074 [Desarmillaria tabescens]|uniref:Uncharacterized protein n=1 Tax=Armillaria tabescens TaxID=1929756 RepID=A0AA39J3H8_ARMTA|nr:uncharacterized protein EV420DRAFT_321074 [Desarmillaria tabescens]KAK0435445.1 hypothetical protein EV420DRAFT_321074 [Desarmillaria tabescens]
MLAISMSSILDLSSIAGDRLYPPHFLFFPARIFSRQSLLRCRTSAFNALSSVTLGLMLFPSCYVLSFSFSLLYLLISSANIWLPFFSAPVYDISITFIAFTCRCSSVLSFCNCFGNKLLSEHTPLTGDCFSSSAPPLNPARVGNGFLFIIIALAAELSADGREIEHTEANNTSTCII